MINYRKFWYSELSNPFRAIVQSIMMLNQNDLQIINNVGTDYFYRVPFFQEIFFDHTRAILSTTKKLSTVQILISYVVLRSCRLIQLEFKDLDFLVIPGVVVCVIVKVFNYSISWWPQKPNFHIKRANFELSIRATKVLYRFNTNLFNRYMLQNISSDSQNNFILGNNTMNRAFNQLPAFKSGLEQFVLFNY